MSALPTPIPTMANRLAELESRVDRAEAALATERIQNELWVSLLTATLERLNNRLQMVEAKLPADHTE